jgi:DNA-binding transcriptional MerR regulator
MPSSAATPADGPVRIPDKLYFRISEVSQLTGVKPYVLRYWESEFTRLSPKKSGTGQRLYRRKDVELILEVKHLLYEKRFTIEGARRLLGQRTRRSEPKPERVAAVQSPLFETPSGLQAVRRQIAEIIEMLR